MIVDVPLNCFNKINNTTGQNVLIGNSACLSALTRIGAIIFSGANALARNGFHIAGIMARGNLGGRRLLRLTTRIRSRSGRPITRSVHRTCKRAVSTSTIRSCRRVTNRNVHTAIGNHAILTNGSQLLRHRTVPRSIYIMRNAITRLTISKRCDNHVVVTSRLGSSTIRTVHTLRTRNVRATVLANSDRSITSDVTGGLNLSRCQTRLLPRNGMRTLRNFLRRTQRAGNGITFINSNVGSTPIVTETSINVTVNKLNSSTTVRATSIIVVASTPSGMTRTVRVTRGAQHVI